MKDIVFLLFGIEVCCAADFDEGNKPINCMLKIVFWQAMTGDAITMRYKSEDGIFRNIFIDAGYVGTYKRTIKQALLEVLHHSEKVDLWIVTHTDNDHIGGVEAFIKDKRIAGKETLVNEYWFNWSDYKLHLPDGKIGSSQGILLRDYLREKGKLWDVDITNATPPVDLHGMRITFLSPDANSLQQSKSAWNKYERNLIAGKIPDHSQTVEYLGGAPFNEDESVWNRGSIAFIGEWNGKRIFFTGDSHPSVLIKALRGLGYSEEKRLFVDLMKLSHHGSKGNTSPELLELIDCNHYVICANGVAHGLPDKTTLAWLLTYPARNVEEQVMFYFNHDTPALRKLFDVDTDAQERYNFRCVFPVAHEYYLKIVL